jgi:hypothetical protein
MDNIKATIYAMLLLGLGLTTASAQSVMTTSGGNASGGGASVSYSVGQTVHKTQSSSNGSIAQGVQQPFEISVASGIEASDGILLSCSAYPNPTTDLLVLKVDNYSPDNLSYELCDIKGQVLGNGKVTDNGSGISMNGFAPGTYFLKVIKSGSAVKTFKIIKS